MLALYPRARKAQRIHIPGSPGMSHYGYPIKFARNARIFPFAVSMLSVSVIGAAF